MPPRKSLRALAMSPNHAPYGRGSELTLPRQQFQLLYREIGYQQAIEIGVEERFILWPLEATPPKHVLYAWAMEADQEGCEIPPNVETAFKKRWENYAKAIAIRTVRGTAKLSQDFTRLASALYKEASEGNIDEEKLRLVKDTTSILMHANNGTGFIYRELVGGATKKDTGQQMTVNRLTINAGPPPEPRKRPSAIMRRKVAAAIPATVELTEFKEIPVGS